MKIKNIYYIIWVDLLIGSRKNHPEQSEIVWKFWQLFLMSLLFSLNFIIIMYWLKYFKIVEIPMIEFSFSPFDSINTPISFCIEFLLPFFLINYYFIFYKDKYKKIIKKYPEPQKAYSFIYGIIVLILWSLTLFIYGYLTDPLFIHKITGN